MKYDKTIFQVTKNHFVFLLGKKKHFPLFSSHFFFTKKGRRRTKIRKRKKQKKNTHKTHKHTHKNSIISNFLQKHYFSCGEKKYENRKDGRID